MIRILFVAVLIALPIAKADAFRSIGTMGAFLKPEPEEPQRLRIVAMGDGSIQPATR